MSREFQFRRVNDQTIKPILTTEPPLHLVKGAEIVPKLYATTFMMASKGCGKTTALWHILQHCIGKNTHIYFFVNTIDQDPTWDHIKKALDKKKIGYTESDTTESLGTIIAGLQEKEKPAKPAPLPPVPLGSLPILPSAASMLMTPKPSLADWARIQRGEPEKPKRREKLKAPDYIFVFDDVSNELKSTDICRFIKQHRHYRSKVIVAAHDLKDFPPGLRRCMDQWIIFKGQSIERLRSIHQSMGIAMPEAQFIKMFMAATEERYSFLNVFLSKNEPVFMRNFDTEILPLE